ncbi:hypothetical protein QCA50_001268 [Cerrena zonata]|uniref:Uncharacterized protein n=1 Tax=Cerrena zonata TaxID=2478898 RepID=A0AAW0H0L2_9APHY
MLSTQECGIVAKEEESGDEDIRSRTFATPAPALHAPSCSEVCVQDKSNLKPAPVLPRAASEHSYSLEAALYDMNPKLTNIADRLRTKGISEGTDLIEVLGWPEITQNYFLRTEVGISPFQWMMWKVCFEKRK